MQDNGFNEAECRLQIKKMTNTQLMGTPEATLFTILQSVIKLQRKGILLTPILNRIEQHRSFLGGSDPSKMNELVEIASGPDAGTIKTGSLKTGSGLETLKTGSR